MIISHSFCIDCGKIISCGDGECRKCKGKIVPSDIASDHGHWSRCNKCFEKLPEGTKSEHIISYEEDISNVKSEISDIVAQERELKKRKEYLKIREKLLEDDLAKYSGKEKREVANGEKDSTN